MPSARKLKQKLRRNLESQILWATSSGAGAPVGLTLFKGRRTLTIELRPEFAVTLAHQLRSAAKACRTQ